MRVFGDTEEIWAFILFLYHMEAEVDQVQKTEQEKIQKLLRRLENIEQNRKCKDLQEQMHFAEVSCRKQQAVFQTMVSKAVRWMNRYLTYLEQLVWEQEYREYVNQYQEQIGKKDQVSAYQKISFRGTNFYINEDAFDFDQTDATGQTNLQRMKKGLTPIGKDGMYVNLHHLVQQESGGIIELSASVHKKGHGVLHVNPSSVPSGINRKAFAVLRRNYWKWRAGFEEQRRRDAKKQTEET